MEDYVLELLHEQFKREKQLLAEIDKKIYNLDTNEILTGCS